MHTALQTASAAKSYITPVKNPPLLCGLLSKLCDDLLLLDCIEALASDSSLLRHGVVWSVCVCVCLLVTFVNPAKTAKLIEIPFVEGG